MTLTREQTINWLGVITTLVTNGLIAQADQITLILDNLQDETSDEVKESGEFTEIIGTILEIFSAAGRLQDLMDSFVEDFIEEENNA